MTKLVWPVFLIVMLLSGCGWDGTPTRDNDFTPLTSIQIVADYSTIAAGTSTKLKVIGNFSGLFTRDITSQAVWSSGSPDVASFPSTSSPSRVKGNSSGKAVLTATVGSISNTFTLTVSSATIESITVTPATPSIPKGLTRQFTATGTFSDNTKQDITFDAAWLSSNTAVASVGDTESNKGFVQALTVGETTISATFGGVPGSTLLTVTAPVLQSIAVTPANSSVSGFPITVQFTATGTYSDKTTSDITSSVTWSSSRQDIATIAAKGLATTVAVGTTSISATLGSISGSTNLTVTAPVLKPNGLSISPTTLTLNVSNSGNLKVTASFTNNTTLDVTSSSAWESSDMSIATVSNGVVTGVAAGSAIITATYGGQSTTATVTVQ